MFQFDSKSVTCETPGEDACALPKLRETKQYLVDFARRALESDASSHRFDDAIAVCSARLDNCVHP
jgi:hypothetical protein